MNKLNDFLNYVWENLDDPRVQVIKKIKYGYRYYHVTLHLPNINSRCLSINVDNRSYIIELNYDYGDSVVIESEEISKFWMDKFENYYQSQVESNIDRIIGDFIEETEPKGKDFWRDWNMNKIFSDRINDEKKTD